MRIATAALLVASLPVITALSLGPVETATAAPAPAAIIEATEDILYHEDGRVFHGNLISEDRSSVVFEYIDRDLNMKARLTFTRDEISRIERDVPMDDAPEAMEEEKPKRTSRRATSQPMDEQKETYGIRRGNVDDEALTKFYLVPMKGQMGTDISVDVYKMMLDDIRAHDPDYLVIVMECKDSDERLYSQLDEGDKGYTGSTFLDSYRKVLDVFKDDLRDIPQVMWVHDSMGISSVIAMAWPDLYMQPEARLGGIAGAARNFGVSDPEVLAKFREAYMGWLKGFVEFGGYDLDLIDAMVIPTFSLSATWKGRDVDWALDTNGEYVVDGSDKRTVTFRANKAEDFCISDGTAETLDDLALFMGMREFRVADGDAEAIFEDYREDWRRAFETCETLFQDYQKFMGWANGEDTLKYLGRAKGNLEKVVSLMKRYKAVELRLRADYGATIEDLTSQIEIIKGQVRALRQGGRGGGGGGGGGRGGLTGG